MALTPDQVAAAKLLVEEQQVLSRNALICFIAVGTLGVFLFERMWLVAAAAVCVTVCTIRLKLAGQRPCEQNDRDLLREKSNISILAKMSFPLIALLFGGALSPRWFIAVATSVALFSMFRRGTFILWWAVAGTFLDSGIRAPLCVWPHIIVFFAAIVHYIMRPHRTKHLLFLPIFPLLASVLLTRPEFGWLVAVVIFFTLCVCSLLHGLYKQAWSWTLQGTVFLGVLLSIVFFTRFMSRVANPSSREAWVPLPFEQQTVYINTTTCPKHHRCILVCNRFVDHWVAPYLGLVHTGVKIDDYFYEIQAGAGGDAMKGSDLLPSFNSDDEQALLLLTIDYFLNRVLPNTTIKNAIRRINLTESDDRREWHSCHEFPNHALGDVSIYDALARAFLTANPHYNLVARPSNCQQFAFYMARLASGRTLGRTQDQVVHICVLFACFLVTYVGWPTFVRGYIILVWWECSIRKWLFENILRRLAPDWAHEQALREVVLQTKCAEVFKEEKPSLRMLEHVFADNEHKQHGGNAILPSTSDLVRIIVILLVLGLCLLVCLEEGEKIIVAVVVLVLAARTVRHRG